MVHDDFIVLDYSFVLFLFFLHFLPLVGLLLVIWFVICCWRIFKKAGEKSWKALIPIYSTYTLFQIAWKPMMFWVVVVISLLGLTLFNTGIGFLEVLSALLTGASILIWIILTYKLSKSFGHGDGFTIGLILLAPIFYGILAFGKSDYIGNKAALNENF